MIRVMVVTCLAVVIFAQSDTTIDATGETATLSRKIVTGTSGGSGRSLPIELQTIVVNAGKHTGDPLFVDFMITNRSKQPLTLPISTNAQEIEPRDPNPSLFQRLNFFLVTRDSQQSLLVKGGADLYGATHLPETLRTLKPSESLIVHTKFLLASWRGDLLGTHTFTGHVALFYETLRSKGTSLESLSDEAGSATAAPFSWTVSAK